MRSERFLITGAYGCLGAWAVRQLLAEDVEVVMVDNGGSPHRLHALDVELDDPRITELQTDISDLASVVTLFERHRPTNVIHLAALQVPMCQADPVRGAQVNVVGTIALLEAARRAEFDKAFVYASSAAAFDVFETVDGPPQHPRGLPTTHYGVYKWANEGSARIYWQDSDVSSIGLRPYVVYGVGRDQGLTSEPTKAMAAAAKGRGHAIPYSGRSQMQYAPDVAAAFIAAARADWRGARVLNVPGPSVSVAEVVGVIEDVVPEVAGAITVAERELPFPPELDSSDFESIVGRLPLTPLRDGVRETIERFRPGRAVDQT
jgi:UDP-glucuronate 4-epimerase